MRKSNSPPEPERSEPRTSRLVRATREGRSEPLAALYARIAPALHAWASLRVPTALRARLDPEDLVQEVWRRAIECFAGFDAARGSFRAWLFGIARRVLLHELRAVRDRPARDRAWTRPLEELPEEVTSITRRVARDEGLSRFVAAVRALPDDDQRLLILHGIEDVPLAQAAIELGASPDAVKKRWQRLRERMARTPAVMAILAEDRGP